MTTEAEPLTCKPRYLPRNQWIDAARTAAKINPDNVPEGVDLDDFEIPEEGRLALNIRKYWGKKGVHLTVGFLDSPAANLRARIVSHMNAWNKTGNVTFVETHTDPQVRIARAQDGYWSYVGTDVLSIPHNEPTMNLEGFTMNTPDSEFHRVVRHEAGHTLGFEHEHMRAELVSRLDKDKTIAYFMESQGWSRQDVLNQVLTPLKESSLAGTAHADAHSIMCYQIPGAITRDGKAIPGGNDIDPSDFSLIAKLYPKAT